MTTEIASIQDDIKNLSIHDLDISFLEALANNVVYCLNKYQKEQQKSISRKDKQKTDNTITDILEILSKEIIWAKEEVKNKDIESAYSYFRKAKKQLVKSIEPLF